MSIQHSPKKTTTKEGTGAQSTFGSTSDLSETENVNLNITKRQKRRYECCDVAEMMAKFREEMMEAINGFGNMQTKNMSDIRDDMSAIRNQINEIKTSNEALFREQNELRIDLTELKQLQSSTEQKLKTIETDVIQLKTGSYSGKAAEHPTAASEYESVVQEFQERCSREKNVIITGIEEPKLDNPERRRESDMTEVLNITKTLLPNCPNPVKVMRLGKYDSNKNRPIKVSFESNTISRKILQNKDKVDKKYKIYYDQTPKQQQFLKDLQAEIKKRLENGEKDLIIKYIKGIPKIIQSHTPKN